MATPQSADELAATGVIENLLSRDTYMRYGEQGLHYAEACAALGALRVAEITENEVLLNRLIARYEVLLDPETDLISKQAHVDFSVIGIIPLQIYLSTSREDFLELGLRFADKQWAHPREDGLTTETRWWIDDIYMVGALQIQAFRATADPVYADHAARFLKAYLDKLQQPNGLFYHGPEAPFFWGRGNGWVAAGLAETLSSIPLSHPLFAEIQRGYIEMMSALLNYQTETGLWRQLVDNEGAWEEASCTAMFAYAMEVGIQQAWLDKVTYQPVVDKAWSALKGQLDPNFNLQKICVGTGQSESVDYYLNRPTHSGDFHGQAPFLWLAAKKMMIE